MFKTYKNSEQIEKLKNELQKFNTSVDLNSFSAELAFWAIDELVSKLHEQQNMINVWHNEIKVKRLNVLKNELEYLGQEIKKEKNSLSIERQKMNAISLEQDDEKHTNTYLYDMAKKWVVNSIKMLDKMNRRFEELSQQYTLLKNDNELFAFDSKGRLISKTAEVQNIVNLIIQHISANLNINISAEKLKKLVSNEEIEDEDF